MKTENRRIYERWNETKREREKEIKTRKKNKQFIQFLGREVRELEPEREVSLQIVCLYVSLLGYGIAKVVSIHAVLTAQLPISHNGYCSLFYQFYFDHKL